MYFPPMSGTFGDIAQPEVTVGELIVKTAREDTARYILPVLFFLKI